MNNAERDLWLSYGPKALVAEFGPHGAAIVCSVVAPAGAPAFKAPGMLATFAQGPSMPKPADPFKYAASSTAPDGYAMTPVDQPKPDAPIPPGVRVGAPAGYSRAEVDACIARMRAASPYATASAILRTEPFASAAQLVVGVRGGVARYTGAVIPWDLERFARDNAPWGTAERARFGTMLARHYAAGINDGTARPLNRAPTWGDRAVESVPTHDRTAAWVDAWARWALDAVGLALSDPATYPAVASGILSICRGWDPTTVR